MIVFDRKKIIAGLAGALMLTAAPMAFAAEWKVPDGADPVYPGSAEKKAADEPMVTDESMAEDSTGDDKAEDAATDSVYKVPTGADPIYPDSAAGDDGDETVKDESMAEDSTGDDPEEKEMAAPEAAEKEMAEEPEAMDATTTAGCQKAIDDMLQGNPIEFLSGRFTLSNAGRNKVEQIAELLKGCGESKAVIGGHTDSDGTEAINQRLSGKRAEEVMGLLTDMGIDKSRLRAVGYGQTQPLVENDTPENKALNRRIELKLY